MGGYEEMMTSCLRWVLEMMMLADKVGGWVKKGQNHDDVILEWSQNRAKKCEKFRWFLGIREAMKNLF